MYVGVRVQPMSSVPCCQLAPTDLPVQDQCHVISRRSHDKLPRSLSGTSASMPTLGTSRAHHLRPGTGGIYSNMRMAPPSSLLACLSGADTLQYHVSCVDRENTHTFRGDSQTAAKVLPVTNHQHHFRTQLRQLTPTNVVLQAAPPPPEALTC